MLKIATLEPMIRLLALLMFIFILVNLGWALVSIVRNKKDANTTVKALTYRIIASILLFVVVLAAVLLTGNGT